ncbi:MAG: T9SS type A sorting domain-containing protein [Candidatus Sabulitectum sp.]|nr:T9SS type A sorting domain-containing protein [Candidatus Sabulitectum sp.]
MRISLLLMVILFSVLHAQWMEQTDWSGGPGVEGPVYWTNYFWNSDGIDWSSTPGQITLTPIDYTAFPANSDDYCSGVLTSSLTEIQAGTDYGIAWGDISWTCSEPDTTDIYFQLRTGNTPETMGPWGDPIYDSGTYLGTLLPDDIWFIQYRVFLETNDPGILPVLYDLVIEGWYPGSVEDQDSHPFPLTGFNIESNPASNRLYGYFILTEPGNVRLTIYDNAGRCVEKAVSETFAAGKHTFEQDISASGVYSLVLETPGVIETRRFTILLR